ncbi:MAG: hypothetical protein V8T31_10805 [Lachnospiraceae bacterium]
MPCNLAELSGEAVKSSNDSAACGLTTYEIGSQREFFIPIMDTVLLPALAVETTVHLDGERTEKYI